MTDDERLNAFEARLKTLERHVFGCIRCHGTGTIWTRTPGEITVSACNRCNGTGVLAPSAAPESDPKDEG